VSYMQGGVCAFLRPTRSRSGLLPQPTPVGRAPRAWGGRPRSLSLRRCAPAAHPQPGLCYGGSWTLREQSGKRRHALRHGSAMAGVCGRGVPSAPGPRTCWGLWGGRAPPDAWCWGAVMCGNVPPWWRREMIWQRTWMSMRVLCLGTDRSVWGGSSWEDDAGPGGSWRPRCLVPQGAVDCSSSTGGLLFRKDHPGREEAVDWRGQEVAEDV